MQHQPICKCRLHLMFKTHLTEALTYIHMYYIYLNTYVYEVDISRDGTLPTIPMYICACYTHFHAT